MATKTKQIKNKLPVHKHIYRHIFKIKEKYLHKIIHARTTTNHALIHIGELIIVGVIGFGSLINANYSTSYASLHRNSSQEVSQALNNAIQQKKPNLNEGSIISLREMDGNVYNSFAPGYCTYGAARISPEFFPYSEDKMSQTRTWGGNAIDRCKNASDTGYTIGATPRAGALIVYSKIGSSSTFGHVGKVMYYNANYKTLIVRDMNRVSKFIMTDRWDKSNNENIKCYIYPRKEDETPKIENNTETPDNNTGSISTGNISTGSVETGNIGIPTPPTQTENTTPDNTNNGSNNQNENQTENQGDTQTTNTETNNQDNSHNSAPEEKPTNLEQENNSPTTPQQTPEITTQEVTIDQNKDFSDITNHFLSQNTVKVTIIKDKKMNIGEKITLEINIVNKETNEPFHGVLPFSFNIFSQNSTLEGPIAAIKLISKSTNTILFTAKESGLSNIIIMIDDQKVQVIPTNIQ